MADNEMIGYERELELMRRKPEQTTRSGDSHGKKDLLSQSYFRRIIIFMPSTKATMARGTPSMVPLVVAYVM
jgi:hypothetical protein